MSGARACGEAVLITGGAGSRLLPLTRATPKRCLRVGNIAIEAHMLSWLADNGIRAVRLGVSPRDAVTSLPPATDFGLESVDAVTEPTPLGTGGFLALAGGSLTERLVAANGDLLTDAPLDTLWRAAEAVDADILVASRWEADVSRFGALTADGEGRVAQFEEKPGMAQNRGGWVSAGIYIVHPRVLYGIPEGAPLSLERDLLPGWLREGRKVYTFPLGGSYWLDVGTRESYLTANADVACGRAPFRFLGERARNCIVADGCHLAQDVSLAGGCCLGPNARVGSGARLARSVLLEGAEVAEGAEVIDSILGPGTAVGPGASVCRAIIANA